MIKIIANKKIDKAKWDEAVERLDDAYNWFMSYDYLCALSPYWTGLVYGDYVAVMPLVYSPKVLKQYYQPFFTRAFEVLGSEDEAVKNKFFETLLSLKGFGHVAVEHSNGFFDENAVYQKLDLGLCTYSKNTKRNIKKAETAELQVKNIDVDAFVAYYKSNTYRKLSGFRLKHFKMLRKLLVGMREKGCLTLHAVYMGEELLAIAAFILRPDKALYLCAAINDKGKANGASHFLIDQFIIQHKQSISELDFGGSNIEGVARFYKSFGAKDFSYSQVALGFSRRKNSN